MSLFTTLVTSKIAAGALAVGTLVVGGTTTAAYAGALPAPLQQGAHSVIGAPAASTDEDSTTDTDEDTTKTDTDEDSTTKTDEETDSSSPSRVGPDATGPAAYGLCRAYTHGGLNASSTAYGSLAAAANGAANIAGYCATVASPGKSADHRPAKTGAGKGTSRKPAAPSHHPRAGAGKSHKPAKPGRP